MERGVAMTARQRIRRSAATSCDAGKRRPMCFNPKVLGGLAVAGLAIWATAPAVALAALPFLLILVCPLSMWLMMAGMNGAHLGKAARHEHDARPAPVSLPDLKARLARLDAEQLDAEQEAIAGEIARREASGKVAGKPGSQAAGEL